MSEKKKKMKISMFGHKHVPSCEGGVEIVVEELAIRMATNGCDVTCYNRGGHHVSGKMYDYEMPRSISGVKVKTVPTINIGGFAALSSSFFAALCCSFRKNDVVHIHAEGPAAMVWIPKIFGKRVIVTVHGLDWQREKWKSGVGSKFIHWGEKIAVKYADEIIVLSQNVKQYFKNEYNRETVFIPNGINEPTKREGEHIKQEWGLEENKYILFLGRVVPEKGERYLIESFKKINTSMKLVIAGGISDTADFEMELHQMAKDDDRIIFTGFVEGILKEELYSNAYLYVLPSDLEGMPISLLEAMSFGNCCLTSDIPECVEVIEDKGITFKKSNVDDLKDKMQYLCDNPRVVQEYKDGAKDFILDKYNWDNVVEDTMKLYRGE